MKREVVFVLIFVLFLVFVPMIYASEAQQVENAYACLENRINKSGCSSFSIEEKIFLVLATGKCTSELVEKNLSNQCWQEQGKSGCNTKLTAQAVFALNGKVDTTQAENWLLAQNKVPENIDWFLEIESLETGTTSCTITYSDSSYTISIYENKKISSNAGALTLAQDGYWLKIPSSLYNKNIYVSCNKNFITTKLFMKKDSSTVHVSEDTQGANAGGVTTERVESLCFTQGGVCNYEASLWSAFSLYTLGQDVSKFMPYLITMMDDPANQIYLPESFLYFLTGKFRTELLLKQDAGLYWQESGNRYYDTALALWPFYYESPNEKTNSISWLLDVQQKSGCWNYESVRDTAFILYSIWPKDTTPPSPPGQCEYYDDCPEISCNERYCEGGKCVYEPFDCEDDDGCCNVGCTIARDNDCEPGEHICTSDSQCEGDNYDSDPYCLDDGNVYAKSYTYECGNNGICTENVDENLVDRCSNSEYCDLGECIPTEEKTCGWWNLWSCPDGKKCVSGVCVSNESECSIDDDCKIGEECVNGLCKSTCECASNSDCETDYTCTDCMCIFTGEGACESNFDCSANENCINGECIPDECSVDGDCRTGEVCVDGECMPNGDECNDDYDCPIGENCVDGMCEVVGGECEDDYDCDFGSCISNECVPYSCITNNDCLTEGEICIGGECLPEQTYDCQDEGYSCMSQANCENNEGLVLDSYSCVSEAFVCCDSEIPLKTCADWGGDICLSEQVCLDGTEPEVSNTAYGETCCVGGTCEDEEPIPSDCVSNGGICTDSCGKCEEESTIYTCDLEETCCVEKDKCGGGGKWIWIIFLLILIILAVLGIVFRDKLRAQWMKLKDKLGGKKEKKKFEMPLTTHPTLQGRILPRRILPPGQAQQQHPRSPVRRPITPQSTQQPAKKPEEKPKGYLDEVLKKLKEMGK